MEQSMHTELSLQARRRAEKIQARLRRGEGPLTFTARQMQQTSLHNLQQWCEAQGIGIPILSSGGWRFTEQCLQQLEETLAYLRLRPLDEAAAATRIGRLQQGTEEHKSIGETPFEYRVLCSLMAENHFSSVKSQKRYAVYVDTRDLQLENFAGLVVIENADVFFALGTPEWPLPKVLEHFLIVYRGHDGSSKAVKHLEAAWCSTHKPLVFFGDADYAGLRLALQGRYTHMVLPSLSEFQALANTAQAEAKQLFLRKALATTPTSLQPYVVVLEQQRALRQQAMQSLALELVALT